MAWVFGIHAVESALQSSPGDVLEVWLLRARRPGQARERIRSAVEENKVRFRLVSDEQIRRAVGDVTHQGVAARVSEFQYAEPDAVFAAEGERSLLVALDGVQDPHNVGAIMRSACAFGADALVLPKHRTSPVTPAARKVAAGAAERLRVARTTNLARFLDSAREHGYWVYGAGVTDGVTIDEADPGHRSVLVLGAEGAGLRPGVAKACDQIITLPIEGIESLNVSVAAGILVWEWARRTR